MRYARLLLVILVTAGILPAPTYNLTNTQVDTLKVWFWGPSGYADSTCRVSDGLCLRQVWEANAAEDLLAWVRNNEIAPHGDFGYIAGEETKLVIWILTHDQVNVTPPSRPGETPLWVQILTDWRASLGDPPYPQTPYKQPVYDEFSCPVGHTYDDPFSDCVSSGDQPSAQYRTNQRNIFDAVLGVLQ